MRKGWQRACMAAIGVAASLPASADDFYKGRRIDIVVGGNAGGVYDVVARSLARHMPKYIDGAPNMVVQNMPGAGSLKAAEWAATVAPQDGTSIVALYPGALTQPIIENDRKFRFDPATLKYIGSADSGARMCVTYATSGTKTFEDAQKRETIIGASAGGGSTFDYAWMVKNLTGAKLKIVAGYKGTPDLELAMERGEIDGMCGYGLAALRAEKPDWFRDKKINFLVQFSTRPDRELTALGAPDIAKFVSGDNRKAVDLIIAQQDFSRPYIAPPGTPAARVAILRKAFDAAIADPEMKSEFERLNSPLTPVSGADLEKMVTQLIATPPAVAALARKAQQPD
jgi:tripartite-type tricarboxylate transporter receptor subunit TctC